MGQRENIGAKTLAHSQLGVDPFFAFQYIQLSTTRVVLTLSKKIEIDPEHLWLCPIP